MITWVKNHMQYYWKRWTKHRCPNGNPQALHSHAIYILPSKFGLVFGVAVLSLFTGAINYQMSTIFLMTFLLGVIGLVSAWEAHSNLKDLSIKLISIEDTEQEKPAQITLLLQPNYKIRYGLEFQWGNQSTIRVEKVPKEGLEFFSPIVTTQRGYFSIPPLIISSLYPFGLFRVWSYIYFDAHYYVYPQPVDPGFWPQTYPKPNSKHKELPGDEEFYDLKQVENPWVQANLIAWKIAAKEQGWYLKTQDSNEGECWLFKLSDTPQADLETKLQHLSFWLQSAEANHYLYGLELSQPSTNFSCGAYYLQQCLRQLATYQ